MYTEAWLREEALEFFTGAFGNSGMVHGKPCSQARLLADYLVRSMQERSLLHQRGGKRIDVVAEADKTVRAWNAYRRGAQLLKLQRGDAGVAKALP